jgi:4a-hydroxytetrahydrobiopterin dehydratase
MGENSLLKQKCKPCEGGIPPLAEEEARKYLDEFGEGASWELVDGGKSIEKIFVFESKEDWSANYQGGADFLMRAVYKAQQEDHHPTTIALRAKSKGAHVYVKLSTHSIGGLSKNDFIMAAKVDEIYRTI